MFCLYCCLKLTDSFRFKKSNLFQSNELVFKKNMTLVCPVCSEQFPSIAQYCSHCRRHGGRSSVQIPCPECPLVFTNKRSFYRHYKEHKEIPVAVSSDILLLCSHCQDSFDSLDKFKAHVQPLMPKVAINCPACFTENISTYRNFRQHLTR